MNKLFNLKTILAGTVIITLILAISPKKHKTKEEVVMKLSSALKSNGLGHMEKEIKKEILSFEKLETDMINSDFERESLIQKKLTPFDEVKKQFEKLSAKELEIVINEINDDLRNGRHIADANSGRLSLESEIKMRRFFRKFDAANHVYMEKLLQEI